MNAREEILGRVRAALRGAGEPGPVPRGYRTVGVANDPVDLFLERVADYRAEVTRCAPAEVPDRIAAALHDARRVVVPAGLAWPAPPGALPDTGLGAAELDRVDAVVTGATVGIATTGTVVLTHGPGEGRRALTLVPDLHVCVLRADQVVGTVPEAMARLAPDRPGTWISGPSATSDIELSRVEGVHGPRRLRVVVAG
ncbi:LutC/YkgG family protein [Streptomyces hainanensis]|uniref:Lactate utilization protein C n=1 Tax=Streptomyces hainanensis TaxID=402648 RepID=A0A4R4T2N9_9ACTN|nr:lactate utilization protein C [Streptomyces hainanensis]TDC68639.1 lactate utilization protein C [Streptomyces hainanensis]